jgi:hypothetical protein
MSEEQVERVARAIHDARYGNDYPLTLVNTWEQEGVSGQQYCLRLARAAIEAMPDEGEVTRAQAFDMGFAWAMMLRGQTLEDSRAVGRTLYCDLFDPIAERIDTSDFNSFESADAGIIAAKAIIHAALADSQPAGEGR